MCSTLPKTLTLFMTKVCDFPYSIYDLTKKTGSPIYDHCHWDSWRAFVNGLIDRDVKGASSKRKYPVQNRHPIYDQNCWKTIPFGAAHAYVAHIRELSPSPRYMTGFVSTESQGNVRAMLISVTSPLQPPFPSFGISFILLFILALHFFKVIS